MFELSLSTFFFLFVGKSKYHNAKKKFLPQIHACDRFFFVPGNRKCRTSRIVRAVFFGRMDDVWLGSGFFPFSPSFGGGRGERVSSLGWGGEEWCGRRGESEGSQRKAGFDASDATKKKEGRWLSVTFCVSNSPKKNSKESFVIKIR